MKYILILFALMTSFLCAEEDMKDEKLPPSPDPALVQVVSGAHWGDGQNYGFVRLSVYQYGFDNVHNKLVVEWVQEPSEQGKVARVVKRVLVKKLPPVWSIGTVSLVEGKQGWEFNFKGTNSYIIGHKATFKLLLKKDREVELITKEAKLPE